MKETKCYKATDEKMQCRGYQFELGKRHTLPNDENIVMCKNGFHVVEKFWEMFRYYPNNGKSRWFEVTIYGDYLTKKGSSKICGKEISLDRELSTQDLYKMAAEMESELGFNLKGAIIPFNPLSVSNDVSNVDIENLKKLASVRNSIVESVRDSVWYSVKDSVWDSVKNSALVS